MLKTVKYRGLAMVLRFSFLIFLFSTKIFPTFMMLVRKDLLSED